MGRERRRAKRGAGSESVARLGCCHTTKSDPPAAPLAGRFLTIVDESKAAADAW